MSPGLLQPADHEQIAALGMAEDDILRQLELFSSPPPFAELVRPCKIGDGVAVVPEEEQPTLLRLHDEAARSGRLLKFVPASGAASRMFQSLARYVEDDRTSTFADVEAEAARGGKAAREVVRFVESLEKLPFRDALAAAAGGEALADPKGRFRDLITALLSPSGLAYGAQPKGLIPFHREEEGPRTAFEEHLVEGALTVRDGDSRVRIHFTVPDHAEEEFARLLERHRAALESRLNSRFEVSFSIQNRSTDTVAVDLEDRPFRLADGTILFRPGGHGALLKNLADLPGADVVFVKNIDNVVPDARKGPTLLWKKLLAGTLLRLERRIHHLVRMLEEEPEDPAHVAEALGFLSGELGCAPPPGTLDGLSQAAARSATVRELLDRPLRVCGVVRNEGEPGGGPFWVRDSRGVVSPQIVESSQVDPGSPAQQAIWGSSTHFNPVDLVLGLRRASGEPHDLPRHVDPATVFISRKSRDGRELKALERPGLWNGAMARWLTLFVEVPIATFAPVKTVLDLTRPEHQPG